MKPVGWVLAFLPKLPGWCEWVWNRYSQSQICYRSHNPGGGTVLPLQSTGSTAGMQDAGLVFARLVIIRLCAF